MAKIPNVYHHERRGPKMTKTQRSYTMSVGRQNAIGVTS
ncbi:hypothetical protein COLO4_23865 [Corchorus olitorius]|uniref:Uncharacterized protein n=1 Tax=Corchorus olitorius TaxID=93759 RepID=A0A1R3IEI1_9ROSI|nr:hypothetical protein COLO4_23865 [Corchorus olitorius]